MTTACSMPAAAGHDLDLLASNPSPTGGSSRGVPAVPLAQPQRRPSNKRKGKAARQAKASKQVPQGQPQSPLTPEAQPHPQRSPWYQRMWQQAAEASTSSASGSSAASEPPTRPRPRRRTCSNPGCGATERPDGGKLLKCERCRTVRYCSAECQKQHWHAQHRDECFAPASASNS